MFSEHAADNWDFTLVHDYLRSTALTETPPTRVSLTDHSIADQYDTATHLGDFGKIWQYLGQPLSVPPPAVQPLPSDDTNVATYQIEGAPWGSKLGKEVRWMDELDGEDTVKFDRSSDPKNIPVTKESGKTKARKLKEQERSGLTVLPSGSESENETLVPMRSEARKAIINGIIHGTPEKANSGVSNLLRLPGGPLLPADAGAWPGTYLQILARPLPQEENSYAVAAEKKARLMAKLHRRFIEERQYLSHISIVRRIADGDVSTDVGVHVFIDASNIMIGFQDAIKLSRGLSLSSRLRRQPLSFHNLSLILERGRPITKRVLVGSDNFPAIQEAKAIGYETNILDRVLKAKELTPRQKKFTNKGAPNSATSGQSSGSETTAAMYAPEKWVEQAVDEILHLKILESVVDAKEPSTIILATGDAAEAEYSQGFLKMVERALEKRWKVELVSFGHNISGMYKRKEFRGKWGQRFKIIELDDFVDELSSVRVEY